MTDPLIRVESLTRCFGKGAARTTAVRDVSLEIEQGETLGLVGESGSGKSTLGRLLVRLDRPTSGRILYRDQDISGLAGPQLQAFRRRAQIVFQDPYASLNPRMTAGRAIGEVLRVHGAEGGESLDRRITDLLELVGLSARDAGKFPHQFSGGQRQRIVVARALAVGPEFIVADEPCSALDVSIQAQILNLLKDLQSELRLTYLFITHDLSVVRQISDRVAVMKEGQVVELADTGALFTSPREPYSRALMAAAPRLPRRAGSGDGEPDACGSEIT